MIPRRKSHKQRLFVGMGIAFLLVYLGLGLAFVFVKDMPFDMSPTLRVGFGIVLIAYAVFRLYRLLKQR